jgi:prevent-host-death family protein
MNPKQSSVCRNSSRHGFRRMARWNGYAKSELTMVSDHSYSVRMEDRESMAISKFKATCLAALERVRKTGRPIVVTKRGEPIAQVVPVPVPEPKEGGFGSMKGRIEEIGDVLEPLPAEDWGSLR